MGSGWHISTIATAKAFVGTVPRGLGNAVAPHLGTAPTAPLASAPGHGVMVTAAGSKRRSVGRGSFLPLEHSHGT